MYSLFDRVMYTGDDDDVKLSIHMVQSLLSEISSGRMNSSEAASVLGLTEDQSVEYNRVLMAASQSSSPSIFSSRVFNYLVVCEQAKRYKESEHLNRYLLESNFWDMITEESSK